MEYVRFDQGTFDKAINSLIDILNDLDEHNRPKTKVPDYPRCGEDELGVIHSGLILCYNCNWKIEQYAQRIIREMY